MEQTIFQMEHRRVHTGVKPDQMVEFHDVVLTDSTHEPMISMCSAVRASTGTPADKNRPLGAIKKAPMAPFSLCTIQARPRVEQALVRTHEQCNIDTGFHNAAANA